MNKFNTKYKNLYLILFLTVLPFFFVISCKKESEDSFIIKGTLSNLESPYIFITTEKVDSIHIDTIFVNKNGDFSYKNDVDNLTMTSLFFDKKSWAVSVFVDKGWKINLKGNVNTPDLITINGGNVNDDLTEFKKTNESLFKTRIDILSKLNSASTTEMIQNYDTELKNINFELTNKAREFIENNTEKIASIVLIQDFYKNAASIETLDKELALLKGEAATFPLTRDLKQYSEKVKKSAIGTKAPDFTLKDGEKEISLKDFKDKYLLITFSTDETPSLVNLSSLIKNYKELEKKDVEFLSIIIDDEKKEIPDSVKWAVYYDTKGWASEIANSYNVTQLPYGVLISPKGRIIGRGLSALPLIEMINKELDSKK